MKEGGFIINEYADHIDASFDYSFQGDKSAAILSEYRIYSIVEGYSGTGNEEKVIWSKEFEIKPLTEQSITAANLNISEKTVIDLSKYRDFSQQIFETSKILCETRLKVIMDLNITINTTGGSISGKFNPQMTMPLGRNYFMIEKLGTDEAKDYIMEVKNVSMPLNVWTIVIYSIVSLLLSGITMFILFYTVPNIDQPIAAEIKRIFKNYGARLVALEGSIDDICKKNIKVKSMEDLVKIADEIEKPLFYSYKPHMEERTCFFSSDENATYKYDILKSNEYCSFKG